MVYVCTEYLWSRELEEENMRLVNEHSKPENRNLSFKEFINLHGSEEYKKFKNEQYEKMRRLTEETVGMSEYEAICYFMEHYGG